MMVARWLARGRRQVGRWLWVALIGAVLIAPGWAAGAAQDGDRVALAYVWQGQLTLADESGEPIVSPEMTFAYGQGARLFWSPDARELYIARDDGLYVTGSGGAPPVQLPGRYGRTLTLTQDGEVLYYLETGAPQELETEGLVSFPVREVAVSLMDGGAGRLAGYFGRYVAAAAQANVTFAAARYVLDGGLLGVGRPNLWPVYGPVLYGTYAFPDPGLGMFNTQTGEGFMNDETFIPGAAAINLTKTHLAGPTTNGTIRVIDLITGGTREYTIEIAGGLGTIERMAWSPDDTALYFISRYAPSNPLTLTVSPGFPVDTRSANITLYRLNLVSGAIRQLSYRDDVYGVSSLVATDAYVFATVIESNRALVEALNAGTIPLDSVPTDPALAAYMPASHLWRVSVTDGTAADVRDDVWGLAARPLRGH